MSLYQTGWTYRRMMQQAPASIIHRVPVEVLERITELLPSSTRRRDCLNLLRVCKLWYGPAIRELFSFVVVDSEEHALGVLETLTQNAEQNGALHTVVRKLCLLVGSERDRHDAAIPAEEEEEEPLSQAGDGSVTLTAVVAAPAAVTSTPLSWESARAILGRTKCVQVLTLRLPEDIAMDDEAMILIIQLGLLRKVDISAKLDFAQLWSLLLATPHLHSAELAHLRDGDLPSEIPSPTFGISSLHLSSLSLSNTKLNDHHVHTLFSYTKDSLRSLRLSSLSGTTRAGFKKALALVGPNLRHLALQKLSFQAAVTDATPAMAYLIDDLPLLCPLLEELHVATSKICSDERFLTTILPGLFLTQLELDFAAPVVTESQVLRMISNFPAGRMEVLCLGSNIAHLSTPKIQRACQEIGIVLLGTLA